MVPTSPEPCAGIVLAAGAGTRYGMPKVLAENGSWLRSAVDALHDGGCEQVFVVLGATGPAHRISPTAWTLSRSSDIPIPEAAHPVWTQDWATGVSASLRTGLAAVEPSSAQFAAIMPVDTPDVGPDVVARVIAAAQDSPSGLARATFDTRPGHPVVLSRRHWTPATTLATADSGATTYLRRRTDVVNVACEDLATGIDRDHRPPRPETLSPP